MKNQSVNLDFSLVLRRTFLYYQKVVELEAGRRVMRSPALTLYKKLLRYGKRLEYTDQRYFLNRIRNEFDQNRELTNPQEIKSLLEIPGCVDLSCLTADKKMNPLTNTRKINELNLREVKLGIPEHKSWHQQYKDSAWIFIGGLPYDCTEGDVICVFSQYGEPVNINLVRDQKSGKSKGFCFICYEDQRSTVLAVDNLNGVKVCGRTIRVDHVLNYKPPKEGTDDEIAQILADKGCGPEAVQILEQVSRKNNKQDDRPLTRTSEKPKEDRHYEKERDRHRRRSKERSHR